MKIIPFPVKTVKPGIDWNSIKVERATNYPRIPKKAPAIIKKTLEAKPGSPEGNMMIHDTGKGYPPNPITIFPNKSCMIWVLDLLDRFGGELSHGNLSCRIRRKKKRLPVFIIQEISETTYKALCAALGGEFEHPVRSEAWQMIGKELPGVDIIVVLISSRQENGTSYMGLFDRRTILTLFERLGKGLSIDEMLTWGI